MRRLLTAVGVQLVRARCRPQSRRFARQYADCSQSQAQTLSRILRLNAGTRFQLDHGLAPGFTPDEFRRRLPLKTFDDVAAYVEKAAQGDESALCGRRNRLLMFAQSSGTTGNSKLIPITRPFLRDYRRGWNVWAYHAFEDRPQVQTRKFLQIISDYDRIRTPSGLPCGNISGLVQAMQKGFVRRKFVLPSAVLKVQNHAAKSYLTLRLAMAERRVGLISTANPSTLVQLATLANDECESLIRDIHNGTLSAKFAIPEEVRTALSHRLRRKDAARARKLSQIVERSGRLFPRDIWPETALIAVWTGGSAAAYLPRVRELYGDVPIRDHGLSASEGRMTIPLEDESSRGVLDVGSHFFEFIPEDHIDDDAPQTLLAHELEEGAAYFIVLTTASGLYRYNIFDVVRCTGFVGTTPLLTFLHKGAHISNVTGEKLTESQVVTAVSTACERVGCHLSHYTICPVWGEPPGYQLLYESDDVPHAEQAGKLAVAIEHQLRAANCEYQEKRDSGRLAALSLQPLPGGTWSRYMTHQQSRPGASVEQYKHPCLKPDLSFRDDVLSQVADAPPNDAGTGAPAMPSHKRHPLRF